MEVDCTMVSHKAVSIVFKFEGNMMIKLLIFAVCICLQFRNFFSVSFFFFFRRIKADV